MSGVWYSVHSIIFSIPFKSLFSWRLQELLKRSRKGEQLLPFLSFFILSFRRCIIFRNEAKNFAKLEKSYLNESADQPMTQPFQV